MFYHDMVEDIVAWRAGAPIRMLAAGDCYARSNEATNE